MLEFEGERYRIAGAKIAAQPDQHHVIMRFSEIDRLPGRDRETAFDRPHRHRVAIHRHLVQLHRPGNLGFATQQAVVGAAVVSDTQAYLGGAGAGRPQPRGGSRAGGAVIHAVMRAGQPTTGAQCGANREECHEFAARNHRHRS